MTSSEFMTEELLVEKLETLIKKYNLNYIEAILFYCNENMVDIEDLKPLIGISLKERIRVDAVASGLMKGESAVLPFE